MIETSSKVDAAGLTAVLGCGVTVRDYGDRVEVEADGDVSDKQLRAAIAEHVPLKPPLDGLALVAAIQLVKGEIDEATACKIAGRPLEDLVAEAEAWAAAAKR